VRVLAIVHERTAGAGVFAEVARERHEELVEWIPSQDGAPAGEFGAALVFGGAMHADQERDHAWLAAEKELLRGLLSAGTPALGVCLGAQLLAEVAGGGVLRMPAPEIGWKSVQLDPPARTDALLGALPERFESFQWHSYEVALPARAEVLARSAACLQGFRLGDAPWWGIQFHAEATAETIAAWIDDYPSDEDAAGAEVDWRALAAQTTRAIEGWNEIGRGICARFLAHAHATEGTR
jgi:GMP synthase-like glutamine amidotransferase